MSSKRTPVGKSQLAYLLAGILVVILAGACGGGGGGDDKTNVTIRGLTDDGSKNAPIPNASCRFVDIDGTQRDTDVCDGNGRYELAIPSGLRGYILCSPQSVPNLNLSTFASTLNHEAGSTITGENVTPVTTLAADIIRNENPPDPEARKAELLTDIVTGQDADLEVVATMASRLYQAMLANQVNTWFGDEGSTGGDGGDHDHGDSGGVGGEVGDGADFSPLAAASCAFVVGQDLETAEAVYPSALADFWTDGQIDRPDLAALTDMVNAEVAYTPEEIQQAFVQVFPNGMGRTIAADTDSEGRYFMSTPPNLAGYVRCTPNNLEKLVLGTHISGRQKGEIWPDQDVNPATTVFSTIIAPQIEGELGALKENFLEDIDGLETRLLFEDGRLAGFEINPDNELGDNDVGLVAFSVTVLFNLFYKNDLNVDYLSTIFDLFDELAVDPAHLESQDIPSEQAQSLAQVANEAIDTTGSQLDSSMDEAVSTARVRVKVIDDMGRAVEGAVVNLYGLEEMPACEGCGTATDSNGEMNLILSNVSKYAPTELVVTISGVPGYVSADRTIEVVAFSTVDLEINLWKPTTFPSNLVGRWYRESDGLSLWNISGSDSVRVCTHTYTVDSVYISGDTYKIILTRDGEYYTYHFKDVTSTTMLSDWTSNNCSEGISTPNEAFLIAPVETNFAPCTTEPEPTPDWQPTSFPSALVARWYRESDNLFLWNISDPNSVGVCTHTYSVDAVYVSGDTYKIILTRDGEYYAYHFKDVTGTMMLSDWTSDNCGDGRSTANEAYQIAPVETNFIPCTTEPGPASQWQSTSFPADLVGRWQRDSDNLFLWNISDPNSVGVCTHTYSVDAVYVSGDTYKIILTRDGEYYAYHFRDVTGTHMYSDWTAASCGESNATLSEAMLIEPVEANFTRCTIQTDPAPEWSETSFPPNLVGRWHRDSDDLFLWNISDATSVGVCSASYNVDSVYVSGDTYKIILTREGEYHTYHFRDITSTQMSSDWTEDSCSDGRSTLEEALSIAPVEANFASCTVQADPAPEWQATSFPSDLVGRWYRDSDDLFLWDISDASSVGVCSASYNVDSVYVSGDTYKIILTREDEYYTYHFRDITSSQMSSDWTEGSCSDGRSTLEEALSIAPVEANFSSCTVQADPAPEWQITSFPPDLVGRWYRDSDALFLWNFSDADSVGVCSAAHSVDSVYVSEDTYKIILTRDDEYYTYHFRDITSTHMSSDWTEGSCSDGRSTLNEALSVEPVEANFNGCNNLTP